MKYEDARWVSAILNSLDYGLLEQKVHARLSSRVKSSPFTEVPMQQEHKAMKQTTQTAPWIKNTGVCPVPKGTLIDVQYRCGKTAYMTRALVYRDRAALGAPLWADDWSLTHVGGDILYWRPSDPAAWIDGRVETGALPEGTRVYTKRTPDGLATSNHPAFSRVTEGPWRLVSSDELAEPDSVDAPLPLNSWVYRADGEAFANGYWFAQVTGHHSNETKAIVQLDGTSCLPASKLVLYKTDPGVLKADAAKAQAKALGVYWRFGEDRPHLLQQCKEKHEVSARIAELKAELAHLEGHDDVF